MTVLKQFFYSNISFSIRRFNLHLDHDRKRKSNLLPEIPLKRNRVPAEKPDHHHNETYRESSDRWKKMKLPDLIDYLPADHRNSSEVTNNRDGGSGENKSTSSSSVKFSTADIGSMISCSLENFLKNNPLMRKRKMTEDIDLK